VLTISPLEMIDHLVDDPTRRQTAADEWVEKLCDLIRRWQPQCWGVESGQIKSAIGPYLRKRMIERSAYCRLKEFPSRYDKAIRARSIQDRMATWAEGRLFAGRPADDHWMNSPSSGQHTAHYSPVIIAPFVAWGRTGSLPLFFLERRARGLTNETRPCSERRSGAHIADRKR
jgi:hypothetical protein